MAFTTIYVAPGLPPAARRAARRAGPRAVGTRATHTGLLRSAGFANVDEVDLTGAFVDSMRAWIDQRERHARDLAPLEEPGVFERRQGEHREQLAATEAGFLRRAAFHAARPSRPVGRARLDG